MYNLQGTYQLSIESKYSEYCLGIRPAFIFFQLIKLCPFVSQSLLIRKKQ